MSIHVSVWPLLSEPRWSHCLRNTCEKTERSDFCLFPRDVIFWESPWFCRACAVIWRASCGRQCRQRFIFVPQLWGKCLIYKQICHRCSKYRSSSYPGVKLRGIYMMTDSQRYILMTNGHLGSKPKLPKHRSDSFLAARAKPQLICHWLSLMCHPRSSDLTRPDMPFDLLMMITDYWMSYIMGKH